MKLARVRVDGAWRVAVVQGESLRVLDDRVPSIDDLVRIGLPATLALVADALADAAEIPLSGADLGAPLTRFNRDILCCGWNYWDHFYESAGKRDGQDPAAAPEHPTFFTKGPHVVVGPHDAVAFDPELSSKWDYEAEVALVFGLAGRSIPTERALDHVFGYFVANDVSQRDLQRAHGGQWLKGKSIDQTMPIGPWITTADEIDPTDLAISFELNGTTLQSAPTSTMAFSIPRLIAELSFGMTVEAGDVLLTGTPSGIGNAREPQIFLADGDIMITRVEGLGELSNTLTATPLTEYLRA